MFACSIALPERRKIQKFSYACPFILILCKCPTLNTWTRSMHAAWSVVDVGLALSLFRRAVTCGIHRVSRYHLHPAEGHHPERRGWQQRVACSSKSFLNRKLIFTICQRWLGYDQCNDVWVHDMLPRYTMIYQDKQYISQAESSVMDVVSNSPLGP